MVKNLQNIENGDDQDVKRPLSNEISIPVLQKQSIESNSLIQKHSTNPISAEDSQAHNCNINYTNESICNNNTINNNNNNQRNTQNSYNNNGHAIIDVVSITHTNNDHNTNVTIKSLPSNEQLPYNSNSNSTTTPTTPIHNKHSENTNNVVDDDVVDVVSTSGNDNTEESNRKKQKLSNKIVVLLRRSKPIAFVVINSVLAVLIVTSLCISMGMDYTVPAIVVGLIAIVASSGLWYWLYIAAITAPRDIRYVYVRK